MASTAIYKTSRMAIPLHVARFEKILKSHLSITSVAELPSFPFSCYTNFLAAVEKNKVFFEIRRDYLLIWHLCGFLTRILYIICAQAGFIMAAILLVVSIIEQDGWLLLAIPAFLLANLCAVPGPGCFYGFFPTVAGFVGYFQV